MKTVIQEVRGCDQDGCDKPASFWDCQVCGRKFCEEHGASGELHRLEVKGAGMERWYFTEEYPPIPYSLTVCGTCRQKSEVIALESAYRTANTAIAAAGHLRKGFDPKQ